MSANTVGPSPIQPGGKPPEVEKKEKANVAGAGSLNKEAAKNVGHKDPKIEAAKRYILEHPNMTKSKLNIYLKMEQVPANLETLKKEIDEDNIKEILKIHLKEVPEGNKKVAEAFLRMLIKDKQPDNTYYFLLRANQFIPDRVEAPPKLNVTVPEELQPSTEITVTREPEDSLSSKSASQKEFDSINEKQSEEEDQEILDETVSQYKETDPKYYQETEIILMMIHNLRNEHNLNKDQIIEVLTKVGFIK